MGMYEILWQNKNYEWMNKSENIWVEKAPF
jgi:hypothetical protein